MKRNRTTNYGAKTLSYFIALYISLNGIHMTAQYDKTDFSSTFGDLNILYSCATYEPSDSVTIIAGLRFKCSIDTLCNSGTELIWKNEFGEIAPLRNSSEQISTGPYWVEADKFLGEPCWKVSTLQKDLDYPDIFWFSARHGFLALGVSTTSIYGPVVLISSHFTPNTEIREDGISNNISLLSLFGLGEQILRVECKSSNIQVVIKGDNYSSIVKDNPEIGVTFYKVSQIELEKGFYNVHLIDKETKRILDSVNLTTFTCE